MKLVISATSKEKAEKLLNNYHYSTTFKIEGEVISNKNGILLHYKAIEKKGRVKIYNINL